jgi:hypothetical protein
MPKKKFFKQDETMYNGPLSFNLIKILTMVLILAFIIFAAFADKSAEGFNYGVSGLNDKGIESACHTHNKKLKELVADPPSRLAKIL